MCLINTQILPFFTIILSTVIFVLLFEKISALQIYTRLALWWSENASERTGKKMEISGFCRIFSNIGSRPGPILWLHSCPRECFPCQHTSLPVLSTL